MEGVAMLAEVKAELEKDVWRLRNAVAELETQKANLEKLLTGQLEEEIRLRHAKFLLPAATICETFSMPPVPCEVVEIPHGKFNGKPIQFAPDSPGVYFLWNRRRVVYVGESVSLQRRVTSQHNQVRDGDYVSWLIRPLDTILLDECFYIWLIRPERNGEVYESVQRNERLKRKKELLIERNKRWDAILSRSNVSV